ncbi:ribosome biogenesis GTP-binding protein YihA/YsxC [Mycoplasma sp. ATU-Cv-508]|uniref:ribosome biogenesis GTP-binding protein YihA/YsxC n=1 Tax=Mycoplasma sp. ATU-Cv-508 TaxID=2048001 RepID=UPI000FDEFB16
MWKITLSAESVKQLPTSNQNEVALIGRSNVGKSSLINALTNSKRLAYFSKTPGRTRLINLFSNQGEYDLVDLPGYGYAKLSQLQTSALKKMVSQYLLERPKLKIVLLLIDSRRNILPIDQKWLDLLSQRNDYQVWLVFTKWDLVNQSQKNALSKSAEQQNKRFFHVSARKKWLVQTLERAIREHLAEPNRL